MENNVSKFEIVKNQVIQLIHENLHNEVTPTTKHSVSGIYMIYVNHFSSDKIIPIYIGQAKDILSEKQF